MFFSILSKLKKNQSKQNALPVFDQVENHLNEAGNPIHLNGNTKDIVKLHMIEKQLNKSETRIENIFENISLGIRSVDVPNNKVILVTPGIQEISGYDKDFFYKKGAFEEIIHPSDKALYLSHYEKLTKVEYFKIQYRIINKNGKIVWVQDKTINVFDEEGNLIRTDCIILDITAQKTYEEKINQLAYYDSLTKLPNKTPYTERVKELINEKQPFTVLYIDIDRFRNINELIGHTVGDQLLVHFSERIQNILPYSSMFARLGSDEFAIILSDLIDSENPEVMAKTIIDCLNIPFFIENYDLYLSVSIGISVYPTDGSSFEDILNNANTALYRAKSIGNNQYHIYSSNLNINSFKQYELERDLRKSIENDQLKLYFQPRVDSNTGRIISAEALIRWQHPIWGLVSPLEFIPIAEESGFINQISDWVLEQVCKYIEKWTEENLSVVPISINVTSNRFLINDWRSILLELLKKYRVDPSLIEIEITETTLLHQEKAVKLAFQYLKEIGIRIALDDFGTGYSFLTNIQDFSIDTIKIDRSFIQQINESENAEIIIKALIFMAKGLNINIVAEGVETIDQLDFLKNQDCIEIQGYLFSQPVPEVKFKSLLKRGILKPENYRSKNTHDDRRAFYRIELLFPLSSTITLISFQDKKVNLGKSEVVIEDIGPGGLKFLSTLQLPVRPDIIYQFETTIMNRNIQVNGRIVWKSEVKDEAYQYGVEFIVTEKERGDLVKTLNLFSLQLKKNPFLPDCDFINVERLSFLRKNKKLA